MSITTEQLKGDDYPISADPAKYVTLPVQNEKLWTKYQTTLDWFWTPHDVYITNDRDVMMATFDEEQRHYLQQLIGFMFTSHCTVITKELFMQLMNQVDIKEATYYFGSQADAKKTHSLMYSLLLDELFRDDIKKKDDLIKEVASLSEVRHFLRWSIQSTTSSSKSFSQRLLSFAALQGIIFTVPFLLFKWIQKQYPTSMPGLNNSNDLIWRDEKLNLSFSCLLFEYLEDDLSEDEAHAVIQDAVNHAKSLFAKALPVSKIGMDCELIEQFIEHSADKILSDIHISTLYGKDMPFDWVEEPKTETYQSRSNQNVVDLSASYGEAKFDIDTDF